MKRKIVCILVIGLFLTTSISMVSAKSLVIDTEAENENNSNPIDLGTRIVASVKDKNGQLFSGITVEIWFEKPNGDKGWASGNSFGTTVCPPIPVYLLLQGYIGYPAGWKVYATSTINDENYRWPASGQYEIQESDPLNKYVTLEFKPAKSKDKIYSDWEPQAGFDVHVKYGAAAMYLDDVTNVFITNSAGENIAYKKVGDATFAVYEFRDIPVGVYTITAETNEYGSKTINFPGMYYAGVSYRPYVPINFKEGRSDKSKFTAYLNLLPVFPEFQKLFDF